ncbi:MAG: Gfo/Idh/MocA family oxidoreductase [Acidobacteria bacterium]|nr:Gfo/Idh/MocA family oxidoreductase [Acidobacteriota bacterium]
MSDSVSRRTLIKSASLAAAPAAMQKALAANDRLQIGVIGTGGRGYYLTTRFYEGSAEMGNIAAVCDAFDDRLARAKDLVQTKENKTPKATKDYKEILADPSIDAVIIATPEHLHYQMFMDAIKAGKHIYVEKPLAHTIEEGWEMLKAHEKSGKIVQVGTQNRSNSLYIKAKEMVAAGMIGECHYVRAFWYRNSLDDNPAWRYAIPPNATPQNTDWDRFLGSAKKRPFNKERFYQWRLYWDYSGGISTDLLVHQTDITNFVVGQAVPNSCMASGGVYRWTNDDREVPDTFSALYEYPRNFHINYSCYFGNDHYGYGEQFMGNEGTIEVNSRQYLNFYPETFQGKAPDKIKARKVEQIHLPGNDNKAVEAHIRNWLESVQGKAKPIAPPSVGQEAAICGHLATLSYRNQKKVLWDNTAKKYKFV